jgi:hypothetical protein
VSTEKVYLETEHRALWNSCGAVHNFSKAFSGSFGQPRLCIDKRDG